MPEVAHLALAHEVRQHIQGLVDGRVGIGGVQLIQVDVIGLQAREGPLDGRADVGARGLRTRGRISHVATEVPELGGDDHLVPSAAEGLAHERFRQARLAAVHVGGVEESHPGIDRRVDHRPCALDGLRLRARATEVVAPEADGGDEEAGRADATKGNR